MHKLKHNEKQSVDLIPQVTGYDILKLLNNPFQGWLTGSQSEIPCVLNPSLACRSVAKELLAAGPTEEKMAQIPNCGAQNHPVGVISVAYIGAYLLVVKVCVMSIQ